MGRRRDTEVEINKIFRLSGYEVRDVLIDMRDNIQLETFRKMAKESKREVREIKEAIQRCIILLS